MLAYPALPSCSLLLTYETSLAICFLSFKPGKQLFCLGYEMISPVRHEISFRSFLREIPLQAIKDQTKVRDLYLMMFHSGPCSDAPMMGSLIHIFYKALFCNAGSLFEATNHLTLRALRTGVKWSSSTLDESLAFTRARGSSLIPYPWPL